MHMKFIILLTINNMINMMAKECGLSDLQAKWPNVVVVAAAAGCCSATASQHSARECQPQKSLK